MKDQVLEGFRRQVREFTEHHEFIVRARRMEHRYSKEVVQRVILDHHRAIEAQIPELVVQFAEVQDTARELFSAHEEISRALNQARCVVQEFDLRVLIGELEPSEEHRQSLLPYRDRQAALEVSANRLEEQLSAYRLMLAEWRRVGVAAGVLRSQHLARAA